MKLYWRNLWTVARRDFRAYFTSPIAYIVIAAFLFIMGWMFFNNLNHYVLQNMQFQQFNAGHSISIQEGIVQPLFGNMNVILLFLIPFITMRLFAEEKKQHTIEMLLTAPISLSEIVLGKFLSSFLFLAVMVGLTAVYPVILMITANPDVGAIISNLAGTLLMASCILTLGIFFSALTENQIVAGALTLGGGLFFWLVSWATQSAGPVMGDVLSYLSLISHYSNFAKGLVQTSDLIFFLSFIGLGLFMTHRILDSYRWR